MNILLFTGAGASAELGVPTMRPMVERFRDYLGDKEIPNELLTKLDRQLEDPNYDVEQLIEDLDSIQTGYEAQARWGKKADRRLQAHSELLRSEAEWFVQHICEGLHSRLATRLWSPPLRQCESHEMVFATTNYDRAIEMAAARLAMKIDDGFGEFGDREWAAWEGFDAGSGPKLLKIHGSTDWYHAADVRTVWKLRHPMPLFGRVTMRIESDESLTLKSAAVLPSREKKKQEPPYPALAAEFRTTVLEADVAVFVGTSLRDPDLYSACKDSASQVPVYVVDREDDCEFPEGTRSITESASRFLISTLPCALRSDDPLRVLNARAEGDPQPQEILKPLATALDEDAPANSRCRAIERLLKSQIPFEKNEIVPLLKDSNTKVQMEALGLVLNSPDRDELAEVVDELVAENPSSPIAEETELLHQMLQKLATGG